MATYTLTQLAEVTGVSGRTIRYYISEKLLPGPEVLGPNAVYSEDHRRSLERITELRAKGKTLAEIRSVLVPSSPGVLCPDPVPVRWEEYQIGKDYRVMARIGQVPNSRKNFLRALGIFARALSDENGGD